jgi:hypothetical protein
MAGGDGTLLLPHVVKVPTYTRQVLRSAGSEVAEPAPDAKTTTEEAPAHPATEAQTRQAISAYERYGQPTNTAPSDRAVA